MTVQQQLARLNNEAEDLSTKMTEAFRKLESAGHASPLFSTYKQRYDDLRERLARLDERRGKLEADLAGV